MNDAPQLMDEINRAAWRKKANVLRFAKLEGWADPSERSAAARVLLDGARDLSAFGSNTFESGDDTGDAWWLHYVARKA